MKRLRERIRSLLEPASYLRRIRRDIRRQGWAAVPLCDETETVFWTYTVGFDETLNHPEIVMSGASDRVTREVLGRVYQAVKSGTLVIEDGMAWKLLGHGRNVWRQVHWTRMTRDWCLLAICRRRELSGDPHGLTAFQLVLPDETGLFPWEAGYREELRAHEPELWLPERKSKVAATVGL